MLVDTVTYILAVFTIIGDVFILFWLLSLVSDEVKKWFDKFFGRYENELILYSLIVTTIATLGSLFFSEIAGYAPCKLCWLQRILMYPLVIILVVAYSKSDREVFSYALPLAGLGIPIAAYHYALQNPLLPSLPTRCKVVGYSVSCSDHFTMTFGYITIPMMALTAFALITILMWRLKNKITKSEI
jgi:disulfide bond formation protein DsbB